MRAFLSFIAINQKWDKLPSILLTESDYVQNVIMEYLLPYCSFWTIFGAVCVTKWYTPPEALCVGSSAYLYIYVPT